MNKIAVIVLILVLLSHTAVGQTPTGISQTDEIIKAEHQNTRDWCQEQWELKEAYIDERLDQEMTKIDEQLSSALWLDRLITFGLVFLGLFLGLTLRTFLDFRRGKRIKELDELAPAPKPPKDLPELSKEPSPISKYKGKDVFI